MRAVDRPSYPRPLHAGAWWLWAIGLAAAASRTTNPILLLLLLSVTGFVVASRRTDAPWAHSYAAFLKLGLVLIAVRVVLQAFLSADGQGAAVLFTLPQVPLPAWAAGVKLGGVVTAEAVLSAVYDGLQLATILCCVGAANALASARRLLGSLPGALYEVGVAAVVALTFAPQLVTDAGRVRSAHRLRGQPGGGLRSLRRTALPVLEGALERSVELAAAMDSRGYGRTSDAGRVSRRMTGGLVAAGLLGICVGVYGLLDATASSALGLPAMLVGVVLAAFGLALGGRRTGRSRYRPDPWALPEWLVVGSAAMTVAAMVVTGLRDPLALHLAGPLVTPAAPPLAVAGILVALAPAWLAPVAGRR
jgi:energy-coupling factor transport system permease protein